MKFFITIVSLISPLVTANQTSAPAPDDLAGRFVYSYEADNYQVNLLRYGPAEKNQYLIQFTDNNSEKEDKILLSIKKCNDEKCRSFQYIPLDTRFGESKIHKSGGWYKDGALQPYLVEIGKIETADFIKTYQNQQSNLHATNL